MTGYAQLESDCNSLFSVISGRMRGVASESTDPQLMVVARMAAKQLAAMTQKEVS
jgi:hypothetical protein